MTRLTYPWWIIGQTREVLPKLPLRLDDNGLGCVYALELRSGLIKIGCSKVPAQRIDGLIREFRDYARDPVVTISLSLPTGDYEAVEKAIHAQLDDRRATGELFRCDDQAITLAMLCAFAGVSVKPVKRQYRRRAGRPPRPWFRAGTQTWYVHIDGRRHNLGPDAAEAQARYASLMEATGRPAVICTAPDMA